MASLSSLSYTGSNYAVVVVLWCSGGCEGGVADNGNFADVLHWEGEKKMLNLKLFLTGEQPPLTKLRWMSKASKQYHITLY